MRIDGVVVVVVDVVVAVVVVDAVDAVVVFGPLAELDIGASSAMGNYSI